MPKPGWPPRHAHRCLDRQHLELRPCRLARHAVPVGHRLELRAMVDRQRHQRVGLGAARRRPVNVAERRILAQRSLRAAMLEEVLSSAQVGYSGEHSRRDTAKAPHAFAQVAAVASGSPFSQPRRKPDMKASPAPSTL